MRISLYQQKYSPALAIRIIPRVIPELEDLGVPKIVLNMLMDHSQGMFLVCGVTGSGKSTTLAAGINNLNRDKDLHILTLEDPVEYVHEDRRATIHQREIGPDTNTFKTALRHALRQDPDVILVGEMRDYETMQMALEAAETGHLVLATVHSRDSGAVIKRLVASFPAHQQDQVRMQLADALIGVVIQKLIPASNSTTGRYLATEIMVADDAIRNNIRENKLHMIKNIIEGQSGTTGAHLMDQSLARLVYEGKVSRDIAIRESANPKDFEEAYSKFAEGVRTIH
jgi:twitching motility protein PilT